MTMEAEGTWAGPGAVVQDNSVDLPAYVSDGIGLWAGIPATGLRAGSREVVAVPFNIVNSYAVSFGHATVKGGGRKRLGDELHSEVELQAFALRDIDRMKQALAMTARSAIGNQVRDLFPTLDPDSVAATGASAVVNTICGTCAGSSLIPCLECRGTLEVRCRFGCEDGKQACYACGGTGSRTEACYSCGGTRGSYAPAPTWDWQKQQSPGAGQWVPCSSCNGSGGRQTTCNSCSYGKVACTACGGRGRQECSGCDRTGKIPCRDCIGGYNHLHYSPQVSISHSHEIVCAPQVAPGFDRAVKLAAARLGELSRHAGEPGYELRESTLVRTHAVEVELVRYCLRHGEQARALVVSDEAGEVLDYGGIGDSLLAGAIAPPQESGGTAREDSGSPGYRGTRLHAILLETLAFPIGLAAMVPGWVPGARMIEERFLATTSHFVTPAFAGAMVAGSIRMMRQLLLRSHGIALAIVMLVVAMLAAAIHFEVLAPGSALLRPLYVAFAALALLVVAEARLVAGLRRETRPPGPGSRSALAFTQVMALLARNPAHWLCVAVYLALPWLLSRLV